ncbi:lipocalin-like domain-containing protein [Limimaricola sp.]|uniref:lipocalin-like domain-containing protein n=1 Tax=Limimaricola sp. TaxID=2211665 RepID=UPI0025C65A32|nr:lipocalin-like domain-containing protein [Limimaricola sp.]
MTIGFITISANLATAQGFAGLGTSADGFALPQPGHTFSFPDDYGTHPDFRIEWWYVTANLIGPDGTPYGVQWTLFRSALTPRQTDGWDSPQLWMGHAAITTPDHQFVTERLARGGIGQAGVTASPFAAWIDDWHLSGGMDAPEMAASGPDFAYNLHLQATGPLVLQGDHGYSVKSSENRSSYYYSQPFYTISGKLTLPSGDVPVTGSAWLDREWSSQPLSADQTGWDWFALNFDDGAKLMAYRLRNKNGSTFGTATWISEDGTTTLLHGPDFTATPLESHAVAGHHVPVHWRLQVPRFGVDVTIAAINPDAWMPTSVPYWEGPVTIEGSHAGHGYLEMTGHD